MQSIDKKKLCEIILTVLRVKTQLSYEDINEKKIKSWDSLAKLNLILTIEQEFKVQISVVEAEKFISFNDILLILENK